MVPFLSFITVALAGMAVASVGNGLSRRESRMDSSLGKRDFDCSTSTQQSFTAAAYIEAYTLAEFAIHYINQTGVSDPVYIDYFGNNRGDYVDNQLILGVFTAVSRDTSHTLSCSDPTSVCPQLNVNAYTPGNGDPHIYFCPSFYNLVTTSSLCTGTSVDSDTIRGGIMLSIVAFAQTVAGGSPIGCSAARSIASSPTLNADNYSCFAMQVYANTQCPQ